MSRKLIKPLNAFSLCIILLGMAGMPGVAAADAQDLIEPCADCHGKDGASTEPDVPIIAGPSAVYTIDSMIAYQEEERPCPETEYLSGDKKGQKTTMCKIAKELDEKEIEEIAKYFAAKPFVRARQEFDPVLAAKGEKIHDDACKKCHAEGGSLASDDSGILAGQWMPYLRQCFKDYSSGDRPMVKKMKPKYNKLEDADLEALVHYYGSFK